MEGMRILGIDPGLGIVGFGLVDVASSGQFHSCEWGIVSTSKDRSDSQRLQEIFEDITAVVQRLKPDVVSMEKLFFFRNVTTMVPVSQARGVLLLVMEMQGLPVYEYTPMQVKQAMTGYGKSTKQEIQAMVQTLLNLEKLPRPDDAADALAMAICHYNHTGRHPHEMQNQERALGRIDI